MFIPSHKASPLPAQTRPRKPRPLPPAPKDTTWLLWELHEIRSSWRVLLLAAGASVLVSILIVWASTALQSSFYH